MNHQWRIAARPDGRAEESDFAWTEEDVQKYEARHPVGTKARLALDLFLYTGVRISDVVRLGRGMERDGCLVFTEEKGGSRTPKRHVLQILPPLRRSIDATSCATTHLVYLVTEFGTPYTKKGLGNWFKRRCREAGVDPDLSAHGLRKLGAIRCAELVTNQPIGRRRIRHSQQRFGECQQGEPGG